MKRRYHPIAIVVATPLLFGLLGSSCEELPPPAPTVAVAEVIRGEMTVSRGGHEREVSEPIRVERSATVATGADGRGRVRLDSGASFLLDHGTSLQLELAEVTLERGRLWVDASNAEETTVTTPGGSVSASGATFAVEMRDGPATVYCGSGEVTFRTSGADGRLQQGERLVLDGQSQPEPEDLWEDWTGGLADPSPQRYLQPTAVGLLAGRRLGDLGRARQPLPVRAHEVRVGVEGDLATTEVIQTFFNARSDQLETEYLIRLPDGAIVSEFAVDLGSGFQSSSVNAWATSSGCELAWTSPNTATSTLSYDGPGRLRARLYPVMPGATVRVRLRYSEWLERHDDLRTYVYPMGTASDPPLLGEFTLEVDTSDAQASAVRAGMGAEVEAQRVVLRRSDFRPRADFYLDLVDAEDLERPEDTALAYVVDAPRQPGTTPAEGSDRYVLFDIPTPEAPERASAPPLELVLLVDVSGATDPEDLELARSIVESVLRQLTPTDRVSLLLGDVTAHPAEGAAELREVTAESREVVLTALSRARIGGATDLGQSLRDAAELVSNRPRGAVLYLGDGMPTTGPLDASSLGEALASITAPPRFFALGVGDDANIGLLDALFGDHARLVRQRTEASRAVMELLAEAARPTLRGVEVDLGPTVERVFPRPPLILSAGRHLRLVGRLREDLPTEIRLTGQVDGQTIDQRYRVQQDRVEDQGEIRRRWATKRLAELLDQDAGREALVELGVRFGVVTPWTSLVVDSSRGQTYAPITGFDHDPLAQAWPLAGGTSAIAAGQLSGRAQGWRRNTRQLEGWPSTTPESTWVSRVSESADDGYGGSEAEAEEALARAAALRALRTNERGPRGCYERRLLVRPDLSGAVRVIVEVDGAGVARSARLASSSLNDEDAEQCVVTEVQGIRFPSTGVNRSITLSHNYNFAATSREIGVRRTCSDASGQSLEVRRALWRERLAANRGVRGALTVWREAGGQCELTNWRARRTLLGMMLRHVGSVAGQVRLYQAFGPDSSVGSYLIRAIIRNVRTPQDVDIVRAGLGFEVPVDWGYFSRLWHRDDDPEARLRLVRRWLEALPHEMDLRLRLLSLLEQTGELDEARRVARELRADPLADARVRTAVGEFWLRQDNVAEARRVFSEIVEHAPLDPWARRRLGDLYRAHGWHDDAYREYLTLARLRPDDPSVMLILARAAAGAGRVDEALRLEQELSESVPPSIDQGAAAFARLWTTIRLARLEHEADSDELREAIRRRERASGALRNPPAVFAALTWEHPDDHPQLYLRYPSMEDDEWLEVPLRGQLYGVEAVRIREREDGDHLLEVRRVERDELRDIEAELLFIIAPGSEEEQILRQPIQLTREERNLRFRLTADNALEPVEV